MATAPVPYHPSPTLADELLAGFRDHVTSTMPVIEDNIMDELFVGWAGTSEPTQRTVVEISNGVTTEWYPEQIYMKR
jgi:hypothetical protein